MRNLPHSKHKEPKAMAFLVEGKCIVLWIFKHKLRHITTYTHMESVGPAIQDALEEFQDKRSSFFIKYIIDTVQPGWYNGIEFIPQHYKYNAQEDVPKN